MEPLRAKVIPIPHNLNLLSVIIPYYGFVNECAELFLQLDRKSRTVWNSNLKAILDVIMNYKQCTLVKDIQRSFSKGLAEKLLIANNHLYFSLKVDLLTPSDFQGINLFMDEMILHPRHQFHKINIQLKPNTIKKCNDFIEKYSLKGFDLEAISFEGRSLEALRNRLSLRRDQYPFKRFAGPVKIMYPKSCFEDPSSWLDASINKIPKTKNVGNIMKILYKDGKTICIDFRALNTILELAEDIEFENCQEECRTLELDTISSIIKPTTLFTDPMTIKCLDKLLTSLPNVDKLICCYPPIFTNLVSEVFVDSENSCPNLSKITYFEFTSEFDDYDVIIDVKLDKAELIYIDPSNANIHVFLLSDVTLKIDREKASYVKESELVDVEEESKEGIRVDSHILIKFRHPNSIYHLSFTKIKKIEVCDKIPNLNKIQSDLTLRIKCSSPIILPQAMIPSVPLKTLIGARYIIDTPTLRPNGAMLFPFVTFNNILSSVRPKYFFNLWIEPSDKKNKNWGDSNEEITRMCKIDYSHCIKAIESLPNNGLVSIFINTYFRRYVISPKPDRSIGVVKYELTDKQLYKEFKKDCSGRQFCVLLDKLQTTNLQEFRSEGIIYEDEVVKKFCELCEANLAIRDIELNLEHLRHVKQILYSLRNNYVIKTVRLLTEQKIKEANAFNNEEEVKDSDDQALLCREILEYCEEFRNKRIGTEIMLNTTHKRFKCSIKKGFDLYYK
ncbi:unnamed protein product [Moneuplotes crassus]|uniref:Uncharacterized protein n=1 Tax=Euplotes crassus TaxID=5936 RepID=A0AAD1Y4Q1_EUPCR|nr:unnamed protein product [Moneuplotes crassus]